MAAFSWIDLAGYLASVLVFVTFCMRTMLPLRLAAIASNILFIVYGLLGGIYPVLLLHVVLLPMNVWRTVEMVRLARRVRKAVNGTLSLASLKPFAAKVTLRPGVRLFAKADHADHMYFIVSGQIVLDESGIVLGPGELLGEIGMFAPERQRTQSARCLQDALLLRIEGRDLERLCVQNPEVAFALLRIITSRLIGNSRPAPALHGSPPG